MAFAVVSHFLVDMMIGIWPVYKTLAKVDLAIAGLIGGACAIAGEGLQIFFGSLSDRGYRKTVILGGLIASTASVCFVYTQEVFGFFVFYLITCMGSGAFHPAAASLVGSLPSNRMGLLMAIFTCGGAIGMALSQVIFLQTHQFFEGQVFWLALPTAILAILIYFSRIAGQPKSSEATPHFNFKAFGDFFRRKDLRMLYFSQICSATMLWGTMFLLPDFLSVRGYEPWISFGGGHMMFILGSAAMMIPGGYLADRYSSRSVILTAMISGMILFYTLLFLPLLDDISTLFILFLFGASLGVINPVAVALGTRLEPNKKGMVSAFLMGLVWCVSEGIGVGGGGFIATFFTDDAPAKSLAILGTLFFIGVILSYYLPQEAEKTLALESI